MSVTDATVPPAADETVTREDDGDGCCDSNQRRWRRSQRRQQDHRLPVTTATSVGSKGSTFIDIERGSWQPDTAANGVTDRTPLMLNVDDEDDNACVVYG